MANITVINPFEVPKVQEEQALAMWDRFAEYFRRQPGYISVKKMALASIQEDSHT